jgi:crotonobetainyl-CoA:carnitine CoA-transferase CaiB-like acyl-CoA transferase
VSAMRHPVVGRIDMAGLGFDLSDTPGRVQGPPVYVGQESREILREVGYADDVIDQLCADGVVLDASRTSAGVPTGAPPGV